MSPRIGMSGTQSKHVVPTNINSRPLVGSGIDKNIAYQLSDTFAFKAKEDGTVESINNSLGVMILKYKSGEKDVVDISEKLSKNSNGGFYQTNTLNPLFNEGQRFKEGQIVAKNDKFFAGDGKNSDIQFTSGKLSKIALASSYGTYEDSSLISDSLTEEMATNVTMKNTIGLGPTANIQFMAKEGQKIETGDPLMIFENDFDDANLSDLLSKIGDEFEQDIQDIASRSVKSKYSGTIKKVNIYYNRDLEDMTESMRKIVESYIRKAKRKNSLVNDAFKNNSNKDIPLDVDIPVVERIKSNK